MGNSLFEDKKNIRERVIFFLLILTSEMCLKECYKIIPPEKLIFRLAKIWFNEIFAPGKTFVRAIKNSYSEEKAAYFIDCFEVEEYDVIERFSLFFDLRLNMHSKSKIENAQIPQDDLWHSIQKDARHVLEELFLNQESLRKKLEFEITEGLQDKNNRFIKSLAEAHDI